MACGKIFQNSPHTNAGIGSNLTIDGSVECDAMVMDGLSLQFGAVGCVSGKILDLTQIVTINKGC